MSAVSTYTIVAGNGQRIAVTVTHKRVKNLNLRVRADGTVALSVPIHASQARIEDFLKRHTAWIVKSLERTHTAAKQPAQAQEIPQTIPLWGHAVPTQDLLGKPSAECTPEDYAKTIKALYKRELARVLPDVAAAAEHRTGLHATRWSIRTMRSRWGSCTPKTGAIRINAQLAAYPPECLEMVVIHELVHLTEPSHNARFHALLDTWCPNNHAINARLKQNPLSEA